MSKPEIKPDTWMPLFVSDYLADTTHLSCEEHGAYLLLLMHAWMNDGALPADDNRLRRICRMDEKPWRDSQEVLREFFYEQDGHLRHGRIDKELERAKANVNQRSAAGKASAAKRAMDREAQRALQRESKGRSTGVATSVDTDVPTGAQREGQRNGKPPPPPPPSKPIQPAAAYSLPDKDRSPPPRSIEIVVLLRSLEKARGKMLRATSSDPRIAGWADRGVSDAQIREAHALAVEDRMHAGDDGPIGPGFIDVFLAKLLNPAEAKTAIAPPKAWHETASGIEAKGRELAVPPYSAEAYPHGWQQFKVAVFKAAGMEAAA